MATGAPVAALTFSGNGTTLATAEGNGSTELWSAATQEQTGAALAAQGSARVSALDFGTGAGLLATGDATGTITLWNPAGFHQSSAPVVTGTPASPAASRGHPPAALSAHGEVLAVSGQRGTIRLRNARTGRPVGPPIMTHQAVTGLALSPDGKLVGAIGADGKAQLWRVATRQPTGIAVAVGQARHALAFSPDGRTFARSARTGPRRCGA
jgi:WD40 repeat protein